MPDPDPIFVQRPDETPEPVVVKERKHVLRNIAAAAIVVISGAAILGGGHIGSSQPGTSGTGHPTPTASSAPATATPAPTATPATYLPPHLTPEGLQVFVQPAFGSPPHANINGKLVEANPSQNDYNVVIKVLRNGGYATWDTSNSIIGGQCTPNGTELDCLAVNGQIQMGPATYIADGKLGRATLQITGNGATLTDGVANNPGVAPITWVEGLGG